MFRGLGLGLANGLGKGDVYFIFSIQCGDQSVPSLIAVPTTSLIEMPQAAGCWCLESVFMEA